MTKVVGSCLSLPSRYWIPANFDILLLTLGMDNFLGQGRYPGIMRCSESLASNLPPLPSHDNKMSPDIGPLWGHAENHSNWEAVLWVHSAAQPPTEPILFFWSYFSADVVCLLKTLPGNTTAIICFQFYYYGNKTCTQDSDFEPLIEWLLLFRF